MNRGNDTAGYLLLGLLALQTGLIDQAALVAAFHAWTRDKARSLADHLVALGHLDAAHRPLLEGLAAAHLARHGGDMERSLAAIPAGRSTRASLARVADPDLGASLAGVGAGSTERDDDPDRTATYSVGTATGDGQRFRILRPHARGGLGAVFVALDAELHREVALKQILDHHADDPISRQRFLLEAEVTGGLEHPGVVPVYGLGCDAEGRPFYAMRLVKGESLKEAIERFHTTKTGGPDDPRRWNLELRQLLNRFIAVCNVIAYAHSRGIIHRDLKPANILLGPYGETLVVDWGLAKVVGRGEATAPAGAVEATLQPASGSSSSETLPGTALGTPAYMSPEQAEGRLEQVGPSSDVYSLGATFYCLLTGRRPIDETDVGAALRRVQRGEFPPPRAVARAVPPALEAVCLKAMALKPGDRYVSARALAEDIERWQADEGVSAYRDPLPTRLTRWGRRHKVAAVGLGALLITAVVALAISTVLIGSEQARTRQEFRRAEANLVVAKQERQRADERADSLRRQDYVHKIRLAHHEVLDDNPDLADDMLARCPAVLRGWEWDYVKRSAHLDRLTYEGHKTVVLDLAVSPDGQWVVSAAGMAFDNARETHRAEVKLWDVTTGRERLTLLEDHLVGTVQCVAVSSDGKWIATGGGHYHPKLTARLTLWDAATGRHVWTQTEEGTTVMAVAFHPDSQSLVAGHGRNFSQEDTSGHVQFWEVSTTRKAIGGPLPGPVGGVNSLAFRPPDGRQLAVAGYGRTDVWDLGPPPSAPKRHTLGGHTKWVYCVGFSPDGRRMATGGFDGTITIRDAARLSDRDEVLTTIEGHRGFVYGLAFSPDSRRLAAAYEGNSVQLWDVATGRRLAAFRGHTDFVFRVAFHPDGRRIIACDRSDRVKVWDVEMSQPVVFRGHTGWVSGVSFSADGKQIASESESRLIESSGGMARAGDETIRIWDPQTGREHVPPIGITPELRRPFGLGGRMNDRIATSRDGRWRAIVGASDEVRVLDPATGRIVAVLKGHRNGVTCVAFSPDGSRIATASWDSTVKLWDTQTGQEVMTLRGHTAGVCCVAFSRDGSRIASGSIDNTVRIWDATPIAASGLSADSSAH